MGLLKRSILGLVRAYQIFVSPLMLPTCRYQPTCSTYALEAVERFGPWQGSWIALRRVLRCHPLHPGGYDPVPRSFNPNILSDISAKDTEGSESQTNQPLP